MNMAKYRVDPSKIDGFDGMSADEKVAALLGQEIEIETETDNTELNNLKKALSKSNSEAAEYKRALREKQSEAERAEAERAERDKEREELLNTLLKEKQFAHYKAEYMGVGYPAETAEQLAKLLPDGVTDEYFAATKAALENKEQEIVSKSLNKQPGLSVGTPPTAAQAELEQENLLRKRMNLPLRK
jgi:hypothetical protein